MQCIKCFCHGTKLRTEHVGDLIVVLKNPEKDIFLIKQAYALRDINVDQSYYLGSRLSRRPNGKIMMNMEEYCKEVIQKYKQKVTNEKENIPLLVDEHPETDSS